MSTIKTSCPICGDVERRPPDLTLHLYENAPERSYYAFKCPRCQDLVAKGADTEVCQLLLSTEGEGLRIRRVKIPREALEEHIGWAITNDDVLDFALDLRDLDFPVATLQAENTDQADGIAA